MKPVIILAMAAALPLGAQVSAEDQQRAARLQWWTEARFGMFIHWGISSSDRASGRQRMIRLYEQEFPRCLTW